VDNHPLLLVLDDLQWCDHETLAWLHYLLRYAPQAPLLIVGTVRPEEVNNEHPLTTLLLELRSTDQVTEVELDPLTGDETTALATQVTGKNLSPEMAQRLYQETEGNPLFVVETVRTELSKGEGELGRSGDEAASPLLPNSPTPLPPKVHAVIQRRLAQLSPAAREVASLAAVIGRSFAFAMLAQASDLAENALVRALDELWQRRIAREQGRAAYDFSHDRIRDVAYATITPARRRWLHRRVAQAMEAMHTTNLDDVSGQIATHYELAGFLESAVTFYQRAATVAQQIYAHAESTHQLTKGLALLRQLPITSERLHQELRLQFALGISLSILRGMQTIEVREVYIRAQTLAAEVGSDQDRLVAVAGLHINELTRGQIQAAYDLAAQGLALAERIGDPTGLVEAHGRMGTALYNLGQWQASLDHLEQALAQPEYHWDSASLLRWPHHQGITVRRFLSVVLWHLGYPERAQQQMNQALAMAQELAHPYTLVAALSWAARLHFYRREPALVQAQGEKAIALAQQQGFRGSLGQSLMFEGWALVQQGQVEMGLAHMHDGLDIGETLQGPTFLSILVETYRHIRQPARGMLLLGEALDHMAVTGTRSSEAELHRLKGELLHMQGTDEQAVEAQFRQALTVAQQQEAKSLELRAAMSLARLWQRQGKRAQAHDLLAEIYSWFTEGFDTLDLQEAKALLEELV
jgi:tetratricopeptide (TPR) repeat protein